MLALVGILRIGEMIAGPARSTAVPPTTAITQATRAATPNVPLLLAQIIVILVAARLTSALVRRVGQPQVVDEMPAGIALGPSLLGPYAPPISRGACRCARLFRRDE